jgi:hypothetical protein
MKMGKRRRTNFFMSILGEHLLATIKMYSDGLGTLLLDGVNYSSGSSATAAALRFDGLGFFGAVT